MDDLWKGLRPEARTQLAQRSYQLASLPERLGSKAVEVAELLAADREALKNHWIPGVELFPRRIYPQEHRGYFGELARRTERSLGFWPSQWASATMWAGSGKGFHIHPPHLPEGCSPEAWFRQLYAGEPGREDLRPYDREQWDVMFFVQGCVEIILVDERSGLERRIMRFRVEGDNHRGPNNAGVIIPAGVAHALRAEGNENVIMVYGTSTAFNPDFEGRIESGIESAPLCPAWEAYLQR